MVTAVTVTGARGGSSRVASAAAADVLIGLFERGVIYPFLIGFMALGAALTRQRSSTGAVDAQSQCGIGAQSGTCAPRGE